MKNLSRKVLCWATLILASFSVALAYYYVTCRVVIVCEHGEGHLAVLVDRQQVISTYEEAAGILVTRKRLWPGRHEVVLRTGKSEAMMRTIDVHVQDQEMYIVLTLD